jgi:hypothetical protein
VRACSLRDGTIDKVQSTLTSRLARVTLPLLAVLLLGACSPTPIDASFLGNETVGGWTRSPGGWGSAKLAGPDTNRNILGFWAPGGEVAKVLAATDSVSGFLQTHTVSGDSATLESVLLDAVFPDLDEAIAGGVQVLSKTEITVDGLDGYRLLLQVNTPDGLAKIVQLSVLNKAQARIHSIALGCSSSCFEKNSSTIESVVNAWKVDRS